MWDVDLTDPVSLKHGQGFVNSLEALIILILSLKKLRSFRKLRLSRHHTSNRLKQNGRPLTLHLSVPTRHL